MNNFPLFIKPFPRTFFLLDATKLCIVKHELASKFFGNTYSSADVSKVWGHIEQLSIVSLAIKYNFYPSVISRGVVFS